ncbi:MAG: N-acetylmuramoyl-L-alanine amidase [Bacteroidetes bacterium]|nr:N-acetylmuramoyl-L-alanine amidase [Bacteroidota bacterium]
MKKSIHFKRFFRITESTFSCFWCMVLSVFLLSISLVTTELSASLQLQAQSTSFTIILPSEKATQISLRTVNNRGYASLSQLSKAAFPGSTYVPSRNEISFKTERLRFAPSSFMVLRENFEGNRLAQMSLPSIMMDGELFIPALQFFPTLETLGLYKVSVTSGKVVLRMFGQTSPSAELLDAPVFLDQRKVSNDSPPAPIIPGRYSLPPDLKVRKESETEKPNQDAITEVNSSSESTSIVNETKPDENLAEPRTLAFAGAIPDASFESEPTVRITSLLASQKSSEKTEILFRSNAVIPVFHKPEIQGKEVSIRFPNVASSVSSFDEIEQVFPCSDVRAETGKNAVLFRFLLKIEPISCTVRRVGERGISLSIEYQHTDLGDKANEESTKKRWDLDVIVLDAGHGGEDAGAISINGYKEKDITLSIAKKTKQFLKVYLPTTKVIMTRSDDTFIELERRTQIANKAGGKLFLSIHCNSMPSKPHPAHGFESYILRPGRNDDAVRVADRENSVIKLEKRKDKYQELSEEKLIVATMAQSSFVKFSEQFASTIQDEVGKTISLHNRGVNQAGFYVLVGSSMPNVLFETAFLSNTEDEKFITSEKGQEKIAEGIATAIKRYASEYETRLKKSK